MLKKQRLQDEQRWIASIFAFYNDLKNFKKLHLRIQYINSKRVWRNSQAEATVMTVIQGKSAWKRNKQGIKVAQQFPPLRCEINTVVKQTAGRSFDSRLPDQLDAFLQHILCASLSVRLYLAIIFCFISVSEIPTSRQDSIADKIAAFLAASFWASLHASHTCTRPLWCQL